MMRGELPWYSVPEEPFPPSARRQRRKRTAPHHSSPSQLRRTQPLDAASALLPAASEGSTVLTSSATETPSTSQPPSEAGSTHPTTPSSILPVSGLPNHAASTQVPRPIVPAIPLTPVIPLFPSPTQPGFHQRPGRANSAQTKADTAPAQAAPTKDVQITDQKQPTGEEAGRASPNPESEHSIPSEAAPNPESEHSTPTSKATPNPESELSTSVSCATPKSESDLSLSAKKATPKSWADLVRSSAPKQDRSGEKPTTASSASKSNGVQSESSSSLADSLASFSVEGDEPDGRKVAFIEPRGLVNTGNMCYMNSVLQILIFCVPFYDFLESVGRRSRHSFKDVTPILDVLILFLREFRVIDSAISREHLRKRLKDSELEEYGEAFTPDFIYDVIRRLPRFSSMRRGHQQDAEEFLGFLLEGLHDECVSVMKGTSSSNIELGAAAPTESSASPGRDSTQDFGASQAGGADAGWLEVGPRQKAAVTRSSGAVTESPITKIFGGQLRSELRVPGLKNSVTLEPYQPLQLDIQSPQVNNIIDALKGLTRPETLHGNFNSPRGSDTTATKQVFIETLPPVLILHLKRFYYDNAGGTQKIWKKVEYPLDLQMPKEVFPPYKRGPRQLQQARYRLIGVVYHHGKHAGGGHYTVDVRRQDGNEWIRLDDTVIRRIRSADVTEGSQEEEELTVSATMKEQHKDGKFGNGNIYDKIDLNSDEAHSDEGWQQVNGLHSVMGKPAWSEMVHDSEPDHPDLARASGKQFVRDNKVAYLLFYQRL